MPNVSFTAEHLHVGLYQARHSLELALSRAGVDDNTEEYFQLVHGARAIDEQLGKLGLPNYDFAKHIAADDDYQDEIAAQRSSLP
jgi:hypothetical protein